MADELPPQLNLDAKWDACHELALRRIFYSCLTGAASALLFFRSPVTRWATASFVAGVGIGSAYADCSHIMGGTLPKLQAPSSGSMPESTSMSHGSSNATSGEQF